MGAVGALDDTTVVLDQSRVGFEGPLKAVLADTSPWVVLVPDRAAPANRFATSTKSAMSATVVSAHGERLGERLTRPSLQTAIERIGSTYRVKELSSLTTNEIPRSTSSPTSSVAPDLGNA